MPLKEIFPEVEDTINEARGMVRFPRVSTVMEPEAVMRERVLVVIFPPVTEIAPVPVALSITLLAEPVVMILLVILIFPLALTVNDFSGVMAPISPPKAIVPLEAVIIASAVELPPSTVPSVIVPFVD